MFRRVKAPFLWVWGLFIFLPSAAGQVVVVNGLGHFHSWEEPTVGEIVLMNPSSDSLRVLIYRDSLWGPQHPLQVASEVLMPGQSRRSVAYTWLGRDSASQGTRLFVVSQPELPTPHATTGAFQVEVTTRYAVDLYRGRITDDLDVTWTADGVRVANLGGDFWAGTCYSLTGQTRGSLRIASGVLRPGDVRIWPVPEPADGVWLERVDGSIVASLKP